MNRSHAPVKNKVHGAHAPTRASLKRSGGVDPKERASVRSISGPPCNIIYGQSLRFRGQDTAPVLGPWIQRSMDLHREPDVYSSPNEAKMIFIAYLRHENMLAGI